MNVKIRRETPADYPAVYQLVQAAFEHAEHTDHDEQNLVERLRKSSSFIPELALVAETEEKIVGYLLFSKIRIGGSAAIAPAPLAVLPEMQGKGLGGKLMKAGHRIAKEMGYEFSVLLGHADYYPRFGYQRASCFGIQAPFEAPDESFLAINLQGNKTRLDGMVEYPKEFFEG